ncbi:hypothetical protein V4849_21720 [Kluyvera ascorbata]
MADKYILSLYVLMNQYDSTISRQFFKMMVIAMNEVDSILAEQKRAAEQRRLANEKKRHPSGLYAAGDGWYVKQIEELHSPLGLSKVVLVSPDDVCVRYQRQYGKALTTDKLKEWSRDGNFPLPRSINGVIGWESNVVTNGLNELSKAAGRGFTCITRVFAR